MSNYSDEDYWSDPDQLNHYFYLKNRYGYKCAKNFAIRQYSTYSDEEEEEESNNEYEQNSWLQEEISYEEISEEADGPPLRKKHKIQETDEEENEEGSATD